VSLATGVAIGALTVELASASTASPTHGVGLSPGFILWLVAASFGADLMRLPRCRARWPTAAGRKARERSQRR